MSAALIFKIGNSVVLLGWLLLLLAPNYKHTNKAVNILVTAFCVVYSVLLIQNIGVLKPNSFSTLLDVKELFKNDFFALAGWFHYLAFDLFVGNYIVRKANELQISRAWVTAILPFTFLFGPVGFVLYVIVRNVKKTPSNETH
ncbi:ABA4-like family protein [Pedobacter sp. MW01-1-1]|uniref:ABA4-like family protein n=1 Tax=Pedobacter sp. MW01-1-1 TaxID=3383027 RepID=UPI003FEFF8DD